MAFNAVSWQVLVQVDLAQGTSIWVQFTKRL